MLQGDGHSLWRELDNGAVIGMAAGAIIGTVIAWRDCGDDSWQILCFPVVLLDASTGALGGGVIGAGVAYIVHRRRHVPRSSAVKHAAVLLPIGSSARALHEPWKP